MREIISINIGQGGIQVGNSCWELYCDEHGIQSNGKTSLEKTKEVHNQDQALNALFIETSTEKYVPRSVLIDTEPDIIDKVRTGSFKHLFDPEFLISGKEDAANNFARGYYSVGRAMIDFCLDRIRKLAEDCGSLQGFLISHSVGGGTGSGLGALLLEKFSEDYSKKSRVNFVNYPSDKTSACTLEPYNAILSTHHILKHSDITVMFDNEAISGICKNQLDLDKPSHNDLNGLIAQVTSSITASLRFQSTLNADIKELQTNLVPYPRLHFMLSSYAPIISAKKSSHKQFSIVEITSSAFEPDSMMVNCNPRHGKYMACCLMYRGDVSPKDVNDAITYIKKQRTIQFQDWCTTGFKASVTHQSPSFLSGTNSAKIKRSLCMISNTNAIAEVFSRLDHKFDLMFSHKGFVHWYIKEGMEESEFSQAREDISALEIEYDGYNRGETIYGEE